MLRQAIWVLLLATGPAWAADQAKNNVCAAQIHEYVSAHFHRTVTSIEFRYKSDESEGGSTTFSQAFASVKECPGYYWFQIDTGQYDCEREAHIGSVPNYISFRSADGGC